MRKLAAVLAVALLCTATVNADVLINEFEPNPVGADPATMSLELLGTPGEFFEGWFISVESDPGSPGFVDRVNQVSGTFDPNGILLVTIPDLENPTFTAILLDTFTGDTSTDIDVDDDGVADDLSTFGTVLDAVGIPDAVGEPLYANQLGGIDLGHMGDEARLVFRESTTLAWYSVDDNGAPDDVYDAAGNLVDAGIFLTDPLVSTFGAVNPALPEPATLVLLGLGGLVALRRRR